MSDEQQPEYLFNEKRKTEDYIYGLLFSLA